MDRQARRQRARQVSYPGSEPGECTNGAGPTFEEARTGFERAWQVFVVKRTTADFGAWRYQQAFTAWKYAMQDARCKLPTQMAEGRSHCFCGVAINLSTMPYHLREVHMNA